ncbi:MAG: beta-N-acetylhexosaminidase [Bryobacteraceae bacterium]
MSIRRIGLLGFLSVLLGAIGLATTTSPLLSRGYAVIPAPQKVSLGTKDFEFTRAWRLELGPGIKPDDAAVQNLKEQLQERFQFALGESGGSAAGIIHLAVAPNAVSIGPATDANKSGLAEQAYRMELGSDRVTITGNTMTGVFYGVQTLVQLVKPENGKLWLPEGQIEDWPDLELRVIYWDDAHHLERPDVLKAALRQASFYKINGFSIKLEGHFQYQHAQPIVEPYALTPAELQDLTDYGLKYHVQLIPYLDGPSHDAFILKHPEYAKLREYPDNNYEFCATNPETYQLFEGMFEDLLASNKGGKYFVLSTDEPYYIGLANNGQCHEADRAKQLGSVGKLFAEFVTKTAGYLHDHGRTVIFWGEYPLKPEDIRALPNYLVNGEVYGPQFDPEFKSHGIRQLLFTSTVGWKQYLFPNYYLLPEAEHLPGPAGGSYEPVHQGPGVVEEMFDFISFNPARQQAALLGSFVAGWADVGINPETMWLGYASGSAAAWHPAAPDAQESMNAFYKVFYGPGATEMGRLYQLMSEQAQFWKESWEVKPSAARTPLWGDWNIIYRTPHPAEDQALVEMPTPQLPLLTLPYDWDPQNSLRLKMAGEFLAKNDELLDLIHSNQAHVQFQKYNLRVFLSIAQLARQNIQMLLDLQQISAELKSAEASAGRVDAAQAVAALDQALNIAASIHSARNEALENATQTWYENWFPRVSEANGRRFLDKVDDVKDHLPVRTVDMSYLIYREILYPLGDWASRIVIVRNEYAAAHHLSPRTFSMDWKSTTVAQAAQ